MKLIEDLGSVHWIKVSYEKADKLSANDHDLKAIVLSQVNDRFLSHNPFNKLIFQ